MPRSRSIAIQSERVERRSRLALTWPARLMAPPNSKSFSVSVVLPASGWEMMAKVRRRRVSAVKGEADKNKAPVQRQAVGTAGNANPLLCRAGANLMPRPGVGAHRERAKMAAKVEQELLAVAGREVAISNP